MSYSQLGPRPERLRQPTEQALWSLLMISLQTETSAKNSEAAYSKTNAAKLNAWHVPFQQDHEAGKETKLILDRIN